MMCRICGQAAPSPAHLKYKHGISRQQYRAKYKEDWATCVFTKPDKTKVLKGRILK